ncbi:MAG: PLP-dependent aminotransferase family protein, partial [Actinomycetota bacterium]
LPGSDGAELLARGQASGVTFVEGTDFGGPADSVRLAYSFVSPAEIDTGIAQLAGLVGAPVEA